MANLNLNVLVETKGANKLQNLGRNMTLGVTVPLVAAGSAFIAMAADAEKSQAKLESVFDSMGAAAWTSVDALNAHATALMDATTFDDDAVKEAQATLLTFSNITGESFTRATDSAADLAAFFETDMNDAALKLGKALQDPVDGMSRLGRQGIIFTDEQKALVRELQDSGDLIGAQGVILDEVARQVGTVAEDLAATSGGQMTQAMNQLGEAGESIGTFLLPVLSTLAGWLNTLARGFTSLDPGVQGFIVGAAAVAAAIGPLILIGTSLVKGIGAITTAFNVMKLALLANPFVALAAAAVAITALIVLNWDNIMAAFTELRNTIGRIVGSIASTLKTVWGNITRTASQVWNGLIGIIKGAINGVIGLINGFIGFINGIQIHIPEIGVGPVHTPAFDWWGMNLGKIPYLADGGIVNRATLAMIGEKGPEAVVPLNDATFGTRELHIHLENHGEPITEKDDVIETLQMLTPYIDGRFLPQGA